MKIRFTKPCLLETYATARDARENISNDDIYLRSGDIADWYKIEGDENSVDFITENGRIVLNVSTEWFEVL